MLIAHSSAVVTGLLSETGINQTYLYSCGTVQFICIFYARSFTLAEENKHLHGSDQLRD